MKLEVVKFGDKDGKRAIVRVKTWFKVRHWTVLDEEDVDENRDHEWTCLETGKSEYAFIYADYIDRFYRAQFQKLLNEQEDCRG